MLNFLINCGVNAFERTAAVSQVIVPSTVGLMTVIQSAVQLCLNKDRPINFENI